MAEQFESGCADHPATSVATKEEIVPKGTFGNITSFTDVVCETTELSCFFVAVNSRIPELGIER